MLEGGLDRLAVRLGSIQDCAVKAISLPAALATPDRQAHWLGHLPPTPSSLKVGTSAEHAKRSRRARNAQSLSARYFLLVTNGRGVMVLANGPRS